MSERARALWEVLWARPKKCLTSIPPTCHWSGVGHMTTPERKEVWEMQSSCVVKRKGKQVATQPASWV